MFWAIFFWRNKLWRKVLLFLKRSSSLSIGPVQYQAIISHRTIQVHIQPSPTSFLVSLGGLSFFHWRNYSQFGDTQQQIIGFICKHLSCKCVYKCHCDRIQCTHWKLDENGLRRQKYEIKWWKFTTNKADQSSACCHDGDVQFKELQGNISCDFFLSQIIWSDLDKWSIDTFNSHKGCWLQIL